MNIIFMGTPTFALPTLDALAERYGVRAVFSRPDAVSHRGKSLLPSLVKARAQELGIPVHTPKSYYASYGDGSPVFDTQGRRVVDAELLALINSYQPDVIVVSAYGLILPPEVLRLPKAGCINIHASLLPRWRGAAPIQQAILAGDKEVGVSIMQMAEGMDTGPYCAAAITPTLDKTYQDLIVEIGQKGAQLLVEHLEDIVNGNVVWTKQDEFCVTYANKVQKGTIDLDSNLTATENLRRVRASSHHARCHCELYGRQVMILAACKATVEQMQSNHKSLFFDCSDVPVEITELKPSGKREMTGRAFKAGIHK